MTTTSEYLNEFTPDWPHGHVIVLSDGSATPFVVKVTDWPGEFPIRGHEVGGKETRAFRENGSSYGGYYRLRNAVPPKREPLEIWVNTYTSGETGPYRSREQADSVAADERIRCIHSREFPIRGHEVGGMTELVKSPCIGCRFAEWERTKNGKLHPNKIGRCTWRPKIEPMPWWTGFEKSALVRINGAWVERDDMNPAAYYATCDAREEA